MNIEDKKLTKMAVDAMVALAGRAIAGHKDFKKITEKVTNILGTMDIPFDESHLFAMVEGIRFLSAWLDSNDKKDMKDAEKDLLLMFYGLIAKLRADAPKKS